MYFDMKDEILARLWLQESGCKCFTVNSWHPFKMNTEDIYVLLTFWGFLFHKPMAEAHPGTVIVFIPVLGHIVRRGANAWSGLCSCRGKKEGKEGKKKVRFLFLHHYRVSSYP